MRVARFTAVVGAVAAFAVATAYGSTASVNAKLVGHWSRNVKPAEVPGFPSGRWEFKIEASGKVTVYQPHSQGVPDFFTKFTSKPGGVLIAGSVPVCPFKGKYQWKRSGKSLILKAISDPSCSPRVGLYTGSWTKTG
jgi:hypothetical protein